LSKVNFRRVNFKETFFYDVEFNDVAFRGVRFDGYTNFIHSDFNAEARFGGCTFSYPVIFIENKFKSKVKFEEVNFNGVDFKDVEFNDVVFEYVTFDNLTVFDSSIFNAETSFNKCTFSSQADFSRSQFLSKVNFRRVIFKQVNFANVNFIDDVVFDGVLFDSLTSFYNSKFQSKVSFQGCMLPELIDFSNVTEINEQIDLTKASVNSDYGLCKINLYGSAVEKFKLDYANFQLWFHIDSKSNYKGRKDVYEKLLKVQLDNGYSAGYNKLVAEYGVIKYLAEDREYDLLVGQTLNFLNKYLWNYGTKKELAVINLINLFLILTFINTLFLPTMINSVYTIEKIKIGVSEISWWGIPTLIKYFAYALVYTGLIFFGLKFTLDNLHIKENLKSWKWLRLVYFFFMYISGLIYLAFIANFIFKG